MVSFKNFYEQSEYEREVAINNLCIKIYNQLKASQTPITTISMANRLPINAYVVPSNEVGKRLGIMHKSNIPWLMQYGVLANDPDGNNNFRGNWVIDANNLHQMVSKEIDPTKQFTTNNWFRLGKLVGDHMFANFNRSNPKSKQL